MLGVDFLAFLLIPLARLSTAATLENHNNLMENLFKKKSNYNKYVRPTINQSMPIEVSVALRVFTIKNFDILTGELDVVGLLKLKWKDELLIWNSSTYGGIRRISLPPGQVWTPGMMIVYGTDNAVTELINQYSPVWLQNTGNVLMLTARTYKTVCEVNLAPYPFDVQTCTLKILPSLLDATELSLSLVTKSVDVKTMKEHGEWDLVENKCEIAKFEDGDELTIDVFVVTLRLRRRPMFTLLHCVFPVFLLTLLTELAFLIPPESGERVAYSITLFLAFTVQLNSASSELPPNSLNISYYSIYLVASNILSTLYVIASVIIVKISTETINPVPEKLARFVGLILNKIKRLNRHRNTCKVEDSIVENDNLEHKSILETDFERSVSDIANTVDQISRPAVDITVSWLAVAEVFDFLLFWTFIFVFVILDLSIAAVILASSEYLIFE